jgi:hypothetical protein
MTRLAIQCDVPDEVSLPDLDPEAIGQEIIDRWNEQSYPEIEFVTAEWLT